MMKKITFLFTMLFFMAFGWQGMAQSTIHITTSGGSFTSEKWVNITTEVDGGGTQIWGQGDGTYGNGPGLIDVDIDIAPGTYYVNCYDKYADGWDGTLISVTAYGNVLADNGGVSPDDGTDDDASYAWGDTQEQELEASLMIIVPDPPTCLQPTGLAVSNMTAPSTATLSWDAVTGASGYNCEIQPQGTAQGTAGAVASISISSGSNTNFTATALVAGTDYTLYVQTDCGGGDTSTYASLDFTFQPPPDNDDCSNATALNCDDTLTGQTTLGATGGSSTSCQESIGDDVWYTFVGNDNQVTITVTSTTAGEEAQVDVYASTDGTCAGFTPGSCEESLEQSNGNSNPYEATFIAASGTTYFIAVGNWINGNDPINFDLSVTCVSCIPPSDLTTTDITDTSANIDWTENGSATSWNVEYKAGADFTPGNGEQDAMGTFATHPYGLAGFQPNTTYYWYVQADCGGGEASEWVGPATFTTLCSVETSFPFIEEFEGDVEPDCWSEVRTGTTSYGWTSNANGYSGNCARFDSYINQSGNTSSMFTKTFDLTSLADPQLSFYFKNPTGGDFTVSVSSDGGDSYTVLEAGLTDQTDYIQKTYDLTSHISDEVIIEFKGTSNYGSGDAYIYLDNVEITYTSLSIANATIDGFNMFPNPVINTLNLNAQEPIDAVSIYNMLGQEVLRNNPSATQVQLDMGNLPTGTYIVKVQAGNQIGSYNLIKQ